MNLPATVAQLRRAGVEILFSVGAGGTCDFTNAGALLKVSGLSNPLYDNFNALKGAMRAAEGDIDGIDFDNEEEHVGSDVMVAFGRMLRSIGYAHVTLCPYDRMGVWQDTLTRLNMDPGVGFVNAVHLQCYSGGEGNDDPKVVQSWQDMIASANSQGRCLLIPGLATLQPSPGPWWDDCMQSVENAAGVAMNGQADWSNYLRTENYPTAIGALQRAQSWGGATFFFYCTGPVSLGPGKQFQQGDAVFFAGQPSWVPAPQCIGYWLGGGPARCSNSYNMYGACPPELQARYKVYSAIKTPPQGGFIWLYDSVVDCLLAGCCSGTEKNPATTARAYRDAILNGLGPAG